MIKRPFFLSIMAVVAALYGLLFVFAALIMADRAPAASVFVAFGGVCAWWGAKNLWASYRDAVPGVIVFGIGPLISTAAILLDTGAHKGPGAWTVFVIGFAAWASLMLAAAWRVSKNVQRSSNLVKKGEAV
ncbi:MAG TPA: hypothetical protein VGD27_11130 [Longimicrobiales bacterium]